LIRKNETTDKMMFEIIQSTSPIISFIIKSTNDVGILKRDFIADKILKVIVPSGEINIKRDIMYGIKLATHKTKTVIIKP
jgi:hypothetical protein